MWKITRGALLAVARARQSRRAYNVGARSERSNLEVVRFVCDYLDQRLPAQSWDPTAKQLGSSLIVRATISAMR